MSVSFFCFVLVTQKQLRAGVLCIDAPKRKSGANEQRRLKKVHSCIMKTQRVISRELNIFFSLDLEIRTLWMGYARSLHISFTINWKFLLRTFSLHRVLFFVVTFIKQQTKLKSKWAKSDSKQWSKQEKNADNLKENESFELDASLLNKNSLFEANAFYRTITWSNGIGK